MWIPLQQCYGSSGASGAAPRHRSDGQKDDHKFLPCYFGGYLQFLIYPDESLKFTIYVLHFQHLNKHLVKLFLQVDFQTSSSSHSFLCPGNYIRFLPMLLLIFQLQIHFCVKWYFSKGDIYFQSMLRIQFWIERTFFVLCPMSRRYWNQSLCQRMEHFLKDSYLCR